MKNEAQLKALQEQGRKYEEEGAVDLMWFTGGGIVIPALVHAHDGGSGGVKKPVRYGTRVRNKQKKETHQSGESDKGKEDEVSMETDSKQLEEEQDTEPVIKGATGLCMLSVVFV